MSDTTNKLSYRLCSGMKNALLGVFILLQSFTEATSGNAVVRMNSGETRTITLASVAGINRSAPPDTLMIIVKGFIPDPAISSQVIVKHLDSGQEIGRFALFPNSPFGPEGDGMTMAIQIPVGLKLTQGSAVNMTLTQVDGANPSTLVRASITIGGIYIN